VADALGARARKAEKEKERVRRSSFGDAELSHRGFVTSSQASPGRRRPAALRAEHLLSPFEWALRIADLSVVNYWPLRQKIDREASLTGTCTLEQVGRDRE
jgi:hypothetical protein